MNGMFTKIFKPVLNSIYPCSVEEERSKGTKELRIIDTIEPVMNKHRLIVDRKIVKYDETSTSHLPLDKALSYQLFYQLTRIQRLKGCLKHDDRIEALGMLVSYFAKAMGFDVESQIKDRKTRQMEATARKFLERCGKRVRQPLTFIDKF